MFPHFYAAHKRSPETLCSRRFLRVVPIVKLFKPGGFSSLVKDS